MSHTPTTARAPGVTDAVREALAWYGEQARLARLIHREGEAGRRALDADGGKRAQQALAHPPAAEREAPGGVVPEGWVLVPEEPGLPMKDAGAALFKHAWGQPSHDFAHEVWRLMLAAAPPPPANIGGDSPRVEQAARAIWASDNQTAEDEGEEGIGSWDEPDPSMDEDEAQHHRGVALRRARAVLALLAAPAEGEKG